MATLKSAGVANSSVGRSGFVRRRAKMPDEIDARQSAAIRSQKSDVASDGDKRAELAAKLRDYANLADDWDGDNGHAPARKDIENAVRFISHIPESALFSAQLMVAGDGDVGFRWRQNDRFLEVGFSDGEISFYGETPSDESDKGDEIFADSVPANLRNLMRSVFAD